jgi:hypothetical protein
MSNYEVFVGCFKKADNQEISPEDTDEFYDMEIETGFQYVRVDGIIYAFWSICTVDSDGFSIVLEPQEHPVIVAYWYNGGAGIHEVVESSIKEYLEKV